MIKIMHISDIHFGASLKGSSYGSELALLRQREIKETFFNAVKHASEAYDFLIISGDLFETEYMKKSDVENVMKSFTECKSQILIITGNHDPLKKDSIWSLYPIPGNVHLFTEELSSKSFDDWNIDFYGHSWDRYYIEEEVFKDIQIKDTSKHNILIAHGDISKKKTEYLPIDKDNLISLGFDYVALGHIHKHEFITNNIAYSGSLEPFDFKETGVHGYIEITIDDTVRTSFVPFSKRQFRVFNIKMTPSKTIDDIITEIQTVENQTSKQKDLYRIEITGSYSASDIINKEELHEILKHDFFYLEIKNHTKLEYDVKQLLKENKDNIIGKYITYFQSQKNDEISKLAFEIGLEKLLQSKEGLL